MKPEIIRTRVIQVLAYPQLDGGQTPLVLISAVHMGASVLRLVELAGMDELTQKDIRIGDEIEIQVHGREKPCIVKVLIQNRNGSEVLRTAYMDRFQIAMLWEAVHRGAGSLYSGASPDVDFLEEEGLLMCEGRKPHMSKFHYRVTALGRAVLETARWKQPQDCSPQKGSPS
jgi:hypothetical protein